jgi:hypothetical protein
LHPAAAADGQELHQHLQQQQHVNTPAAVSYVS